MGAHLGRLWFPALLVLLTACPRSPAPTTAPPGVVAVATVAADAAPPPAAAALPSAALPERVELGDVDRYTFGLAADAAHVYWADYHDGGGVYRARKDGGGREKLGDAIPFARDVAVDDKFVYVAAASGPPGEIVRILKTGGARETFAGGQWNPEVVMVHGGRILWNATPPGAFFSALPGGGATPTTVITARVVKIARQGEELVWIDELARLVRSPVGGGAQVPLAALGSVPADLAADDRFAFVADPGEPIMPKARPCPTRTPCPIATSAPAYPTGSVFGIPLAGGSRVQIARDLNNLHHLAVDDAYAYFSSNAGVQRARKDGSSKVEALAPSSSSSSKLLVSAGRLIFQDGQKMVSIALRP